MKHFCQIAFLALSMLAVCTRLTWAEDYPNRLVKIVLPYPGGGESTHWPGPSSTGSRASGSSL